MGMNYVSFNQDYSYMAVGTSAGFRIYYTDPFAQCHSTTEGNVSLLEMLFSTSLVALVLSPRRLVITNTKRQSTICELTFPTTILGVRLNRKRLVVVLEDQIYLYDISNMKLVHTIDTSPNPAGLCALSPSSERCYLAYPLPQRTSPSFTRPSHIPPNSPHQQQSQAPASGHVMVFDALNLSAINVIEAHRAPLSCITTNNEGSRLATASDKGTIIRVFSIPDAQKLFQFRRGSMPARIYSMAFNIMSTLLCVSSGSETVHVFKLAKAGEYSSSQSSDRSSLVSARSRRDSTRSLSPASDGHESGDFPGQADANAPSYDRVHDGTFAGMIRRTSQNVSKSFAARVGGYLPAAVSEMLEPARDFAWIKLPRIQPGGTLKSVVALSSSSPQIMVVTNEGHLLIYNIDLERGGEGTLVKQYSFLEDSDRSARVVDE